MLRCDLLFRMVRLLSSQVYFCYSLPMLGLTLLQHEQQLVEKHGRERFDAAVKASCVHKWGAAQLLYQVRAMCPRSSRVLLQPYQHLCVLPAACMMNPAQSVAVWCIAQHRMLANAREYQHLSRLSPLVLLVACEHGSG
jgi:hypothetical protein